MSRSRIYYFIFNFQYFIIHYAFTLTFPHRKIKSFKIIFHNPDWLEMPLFCFVNLDSKAQKRWIIGTIKTNKSTMLYIRKLFYHSLWLHLYVWLCTLWSKFEAIFKKGVGNNCCLWWKLLEPYSPSYSIIDLKILFC